MPFRSKLTFHEVSRNHYAVLGRSVFLPGKVGKETREDVKQSSFGDKRSIKPMCVQGNGKNERLIGIVRLNIIRERKPVRVWVVGVVVIMIS